MKNNLKGTYVFKQNGKEIARSKNIITTNGKNAILQYLSGSITDWAAGFAVGAINTATNINDTSLYYEIARSAITLKSYKTGSPNLIIIKGTIDKAVSANIYEIGIYPAANESVFGKRNLFIINDFSDITNWSGVYTSNEFVAQNTLSPRIGSYSITMDANSVISNYEILANFSQYNVIDTIDILVNVPPDQSGQLDLILTDNTGTSKTLSYNFLNPGYQVLSQNITNDILNLSTISEISLQTTGTNSSITVDAIKVSINQELGPLTSLVSRSALTTPIAKIYGESLDIEYYVELS